ncbi:MAG TPA: 3-phosphoshikimate 1-carboxyvinyltransferase [Moheibacter sp.]|nr:3-phosphoshikimate 1-carboxyvinyltransferase [Moheibacter sp.]
MANTIFLKKVERKISGEITISGSKSESNRLLMLNAVYDDVIHLKNISNSEDTQLLQKAIHSDSATHDIHHAGTAMRFLTAYFSVQEGREVTLTGSARMKERPIGILVEALRALGAEILYLEKEGFPPLKIKGKKIEKNSVELSAEVSSQFITALLLIAPRLPHGLNIKLHGKTTSLPYLEMSLSILNRLGIKAEKRNNFIRIEPIPEIKKQEFLVESDWSSASYYYSMVALSKNASLRLNSFFENSVQGDSELVNIYKKYFGVETRFEKGQIQLIKNPDFVAQPFNLNLNATPDIAQTLAVTCAGLKLKVKLSGLETLKIKETDRLTALKNELKKLGVETLITKNSLEIINFFEPDQIPTIKTYHDHRMAMSFAPLALIQNIEIENPEVVEKSYPDFWKDLVAVGFIIA